MSEQESLNKTILAKANDLFASYNTEIEKTKESAKEEIKTRIQYIKSHTMGQIIKEIEAYAKKTYYTNLSDADALKAAVEERVTKLRENLEETAPGALKGRMSFEQEVKETIAWLKDDMKADLIKQYREKGYKDLVDKAKLDILKDYTLFKMMTPEQCERYEKLFVEQAKKAEELKQMKRAIYKASKELGIIPPRCLKEQELEYISYTSKKISKVEEPNEKSEQVKTSALQKAKSVAHALYENAEFAVGAPILTVTMGTVLGAVGHLFTDSAAQGTAIGIGSALATAAICTAGWFGIDFLEHMKEKQDFRDATELGLLKRLAAREKAKDDLEQYRRNVSKEYTQLEIIKGKEL